MVESSGRLAELTIALSLATDLGTGQPMEHGLRTCVLALRASEALGVAASDRATVYYTALLHFIGCTSDASQTAAMTGGSPPLRRSAANRTSRETAVMIPEHHREFVRANRLCVLSWNRAPGATDGPPLTPVFYLVDGDDVLISITEDRAKTAALRRDPAISVCVLGEEMPFPYVTLFGIATIEHERAFEVMAGVVASLGRQLDDEGKEKLRARAEREHRVVLRVRAHRSVSNIPAPS